MKDIRYKLSTQERTTHNGFLLPAEGVIFSAANLKDEPRECSDTVLHHYADPRLAVLFNPIHADIRNPRIHKIECDEIGTDGLKGWARHQRIIEEIDLPVISLEQKVAFAIYCAKPFCNDPAWLSWAENWMNGTDRSAWAASAARSTSRTAPAAYATIAVVRAATWWAAAQAVAHAARTARAATWWTDASIDFIDIIDRVMKDIRYKLSTQDRI